MKKFLYLRINALVGIVIFVVFLCASLVETDDSQAGNLAETLSGLFILGIPALHNALILFIYRRYYPDKAIPKLLSSLNLAFNILCIIDILLFIILFDTISRGYLGTEFTTILYITAALIAALSITTLIQIIGSFRLTKIVRENAQLQLEDSFV